MKLSTEGRKFLIAREGMKLHPYRDLAGHLTIGAGHKITTSELSSGKIYINDIAVRYSNGITAEQSMDLLTQDARFAEDAISRYVTVAINQNQFDSLVSWVFNVGIGAFKNSTLLKRLNQGNYSAVPEQMKRWKYAGGQVMQGLVNRRQEEARLWARI
jgi:lysozyme